jgi:hypothetical protein
MKTLTPLYLEVVHLASSSSFKVESIVMNYQLDVIASFQWHKHGFDC